MAPFELMGIVNATPDSFSDGGEAFAAADAVRRGQTLAAEGAVILDVGGESTRPGADPVAEAEELRRVLPVVEQLAAAGLRVSVDTTKAAVAHRALEAGAVLVNDVTALRGDPQMASVVARAGCDVCLMHMLGEPRTMQRDPRYADVVDDVRAFLLERVDVATAAGIAPERILLDPGIGFGKTLAHNLSLLRHLDQLVALGFPVVLGTSRKSFLGRLTGRTEPRDRATATAATCVLGLAAGARVFRVHDVAAVHDALTVADAVARA